MSLESPLSDEFLDDLLGAFDADALDGELNEPWALGPIADAQELNGGPAAFSFPEAGTGSGHWTSKMQNVVSSTHQRWGGEQPVSLGSILDAQQLHSSSDHQQQQQRHDEAGVQPIPPRSTGSDRSPLSTPEGHPPGSPTCSGEMAAPAAEDGGPAGDDDAEALADSSSGAAKSAAAELRAVRLRNRATQRKYRTRQKERLAAAEAEVSRLTRQLEASRLEQETLAAKLARTASEIRSTADDEKAAVLHGDDPHKHETGAWWLDEENLQRLQESPDFVCTLPASPMTLTPEQVFELPVEQVADLRTRYTVAFAECLLEMQGNQSHPAASHLIKLFAEFSLLWDILSLKNPRDMSRQWSYMYSQAGITPLNGQVSDPVDYQQAARSLNLSPQQVHSALALRAVYLQNYGRIKCAKSQLSGSVTHDGILGWYEDCELRKATRRCALLGIGELMREEHCQFVNMVRLVWNRVLTPLQAAFAIVRAFPTYISALKLIEGIARNAQQQPHSEVVAAAANAAAATGVIDRTPLESVLPPLP